MLTHVDLFSGIGGFALAAGWAGFKTVVFCEKDEHCQKVLKKHWPEVPIIKEIRDFNGKKWRGTTLLTGGFPCQDLSVACRGRRGLRGKRSALFFELARIIREMQPKWFLIENVPGLFTSNKGNDFLIVLSELEKQGYCVAWRMLDARWFGIPQRRYRIFIVGSFGNRDAAEVLFESDNLFLEKVEGRMVSPVFMASGQSDNCGQCRHPVVGTLKAAGVDTMSGVGYVGSIEGQEIDYSGMRAVDGFSRWLDGVVNDQTRNDAKDKVEGNSSRSGTEKSFVGGWPEGIPEELGETLSRHCLCEIEIGDIPRQLFLAWMSKAFQGSKDKQEVVDREDIDQQETGLEGIDGMEKEGMEGFKILDTCGDKEDGKRKQEDNLRYKALGNAIIPQIACKIMRAIAMIEKEAKDE